MCRHDRAATYRLDESQSYNDLEGKQLKHRVVLRKVAFQPNGKLQDGNESQGEGYVVEDSDLADEY